VKPHPLIGALVLLAPLATPAAAQGWRLRLDSRIQAASYRGATLDSVLRSEVDSGASRTYQGFAVTCLSGLPYCSYFRPGPERRGGPLVTTADLSAWGFGVPGLRVHVTGRLGMNIGETAAWPGTDPALQLLEAYAEYATGLLTAQLGRTHRVTRFGWIGFDGVSATVRPTVGLAVTAYGGWGLAQGVALPVTSPALNPLDDFQPRDRQILAGADATVRLPRATGRLLYQREVDPGIDAFVSERVGADLSVRPFDGASLTAGGDYDLANGWVGSGELTAGYRVPGDRASVTVGARRYRPHFPLWTIWGAFSPVPYRAAFGALAARPAPSVELHMRGEVFDFDDAEAATPLADVEANGWRWSWGGTWRVHRVVMLHGGFHAEFGPGGSSRGFEGSVTWLPTPGITVTAHGAQLLRPLEFRFNESDVWLFGIDGAAEITDRVSVTAAAVRYDERRERPDAAALDWDQFRLAAGIRVTLGAVFDRSLVPPAVLRIPEGSR